MDRFRVEVGHAHKVKPGNIIGAIANEADIDSKYIGRINIFEEYSLVDLPEGMPKELLGELRNVRVVGQRLNISLLGGKKKQDKKESTAEKPRRPKPKVRHRPTSPSSATRWCNSTALHRATPTAIRSRTVGR